MSNISFLESIFIDGCRGVWKVLSLIYSMFTFSWVRLLPCPSTPYPKIWGKHIFFRHAGAPLELDKLNICVTCMRNALQGKKDNKTQRSGKDLSRLRISLEGRCKSLENVEYWYKWRIWWNKPWWFWEFLLTVTMTWKENLEKYILNLTKKGIRDSKTNPVHRYDPPPPPNVGAMGKVPKVSRRWGLTSGVGCG